MDQDLNLRFTQLRDAWALKANVDKSRIEMHLGRDRNLNPHNDPYINKAKRRSVAEITSDCAYSDADDILTQQYGRQYTKWLETNFEKNVHTQVYHLR